VGWGMGGGRRGAGGGEGYCGEGGGWGVGGLGGVPCGLASVSGGCGDGGGGAAARTAHCSPPPLHAPSPRPPDPGVAGGGQRRAVWGVEPAGGGVPQHLVRGWGGGGWGGVGGGGCGARLARCAAAAGRTAPGPHRALLSTSAPPPVTPTRSSPSPTHPPNPATPRRQLLTAKPVVYLVNMSVNAPLTRPLDRPPPPNNPTPQAAADRQARGVPGQHVGQGLRAEEEQAPPQDL
jgi:hypothetical protein